MNEKILMNPEADVAYSNLRGVINLSVRELETKPKSNIEDLNKLEHAEWGNDDLEPQAIIKDVESNTLLQSKIYWLAKAQYGGGLQYCYTYTDEGGTEREVYEYSEEVEELLHYSRKHAFRGLLMINMFGMLFSEIIKGAGTGKIKWLSAMDTSFCRLGKRNEQGRIKEMFYNANMANNGTMNDPYMQRRRLIEEQDDDFNFSSRAVYLSAMPSAGRAYYSAPVWNPLRHSWLKIANQIITAKNAIIENGIAPKFLLEIPLDYWGWRFPDWEKLNATKREEARLQVLKEFKTLLQGADNTGSTMITTYRTDLHTGKEYGRWKITPVEHKHMDGLMKADSFEANSHIISGLNMDPAIAGLIPGTTAAGSGSKDRNAFNILMALSYVEQELVLEPYYWAMRYNGHTPPRADLRKLKFKFKNMWISTLDTITPAERDVQS